MYLWMSLILGRLQSLCYVMYEAEPDTLRVCIDKGMNNLHFIDVHYHMLS